MVFFSIALFVFLVFLMYLVSNRLNVQTEINILNFQTEVNQSLSEYKHYDNYRTSY